MAKKCNEKPSTINDVETGKAVYSADLINRIEKALGGVKINRGRATHKKWLSWTLTKVELRMSMIEIYLKCDYTYFIVLLNVYRFIVDIY